jgi:solute:Na+ symporter, SSS family
MNTIDIIVFVLYCCLILFVAMWVSRRKKGELQTTKDYFLAGNTLPWWAIGTSLIAANISAEQLIGMTGSGYKMGLAIASYEWMAAITLIVVGKYFLPVFLDQKIYSMPQFLDIRYGSKVRTSLAILWLILYVFVNLTSIMYLGAVCIHKVFGINMYLAVLGIAVFSAVYTIIGGLKAVAFTDPIQVTFLLIGGLITTYLALDKYSGGAGFFTGMGMLINEFPQKFDMIMLPDNKNHHELPGWVAVFFILWIVNLNYWGCNQYITQRALAAKSLAEAQKGVILAGFLKILMPLIVVIPGIIAFGLHAPVTDATSDETYPWLLNTFLVPGVKGIAFAALVAAVVGSLSSKTNSIATIFTMDIYKPYFGKETSDQDLVRIGKIATAVSLVIAILIAPQIGNLGGGFKFIQEFTGFFSPGIFVIFIFGLFWKRATEKGALWVALITLPVSMILYLFFGEFESITIVNLPFLYRMGISFIILAALMILVSIREQNVPDPRAVKITEGLFRTDKTFNIGAAVIVLIIVVLYSVFW